MTMMSDLDQDLVEEILSRVPITCLRAVRSTCKRWNCLSKDPSFTKKHYGKAAKYSLVIMLNGYRVCLMSVNLNGINNHNDLVDPSIKRIGELNQVKIRIVIHCNGLLLCLTAECNTRLVVWNPYLGQTRWIKPSPRSMYTQSDMFGIGYDHNNNHKILRLFSKLKRVVDYEIYDFKANSWRVLTTSYSIVFYRRSVSLKGNTYFFARNIYKVEADDNNLFLLCFDFTREGFGPLLHLPSHCSLLCDSMALSAVREEQLAVLFYQQKKHKMEIWITTKVEPNAVSWNKFIAVDMDTITWLKVCPRSFFVNEEKKVVVICDLGTFKLTKTGTYQTACIIGENGYIKEVNLGECDYSCYSCPFVCSVIFQV